MTQKEIDDIFNSIKNDVFKLIDTWVDETLENIIKNKPVNQRGLWDRFKVGFTNMIRGRQNEKNPYYYLNKFGDQLGVQEAIRMDLGAYLAFRECIEETELQINEALTPEMEKLALVKTIRNAASSLKSKIDLTFQKISQRMASKSKNTPPPTPSSSSSSATPTPSSSSSSATPTPSSSSSSATPTTSSSSSSVVPTPSSSSSSVVPTPSSSSSSVVPTPSSSSSSGKKRTSGSSRATRATISSSSSAPTSSKRTKTVAKKDDSVSDGESVVASGAKTDGSLGTSENLLLGSLYVDESFLKSSDKKSKEALIKNEFPKDSILKLEKIIENLENKLVRPLYEKIEKEKGEESAEAKALVTWYTEFTSRYELSGNEEDLLEDLIAKIRTGDVLEKIIKAIKDPKITKSNLLDIIRSN